MAASSSAAYRALIRCMHTRTSMIALTSDDGTVPLTAGVVELGDPLANRSMEWRAAGVTTERVAVPDLRTILVVDAIAVHTHEAQHTIERGAGIVVGDAGHRSTGGGGAFIAARTLAR